MLISRCKKDVRAQASPLSSYHLEGYDEFARASSRQARSCDIQRSQAALLVPAVPRRTASKQLKKTPTQLRVFR